MESYDKSNHKLTKQNGNGQVIYTAEEINEVEQNMLSQPSSDTTLWFPMPLEGEVNFNARIDINAIQITQQYVEALDIYLDNALLDFTGFSQEKCEGFVVALSGGLDSAVLARLFQRYCYIKGKQLKIVIMGEGQEDTKAELYTGTPAEWIDIQYARLMCTDLDLPYEYLDITEDINVLRSRYSTSWARSGQRPRLRANHLYAMAEENDLISVGSTNGSELILAAFSTGGPAGNIAPIIDLYKTEVYSIARDIGVPTYIQNRKPLISELNMADYSLYGGGTVDSTIIDPIIRRLWFKKRRS